MRPQRIEPGPGQESVWDYPRPPRCEADPRLVEVVFAGRTIASTRSAIRVLETSQAPAFYLPAEDVDETFLVEGKARRTYCEWKGHASYVDVVIGRLRSDTAGWRYLSPDPAFEAIRGHYAFYPSRVDECRVDGVIVGSNEGDFYGGWITPEVVGPFKGAVGTMGW